MSRAMLDYLRCPRSDSSLHPPVLQIRAADRPLPMISVRQSALLDLHRLRNLEVERGAATFRAFGFDRAAVASNHAMHDRQADSAPRKLIRRMQALERHEQILRVLGLESRTVVAHEEDVFLRIRRAELDARARRVPSELPRVTDEVLERDAQKLRIRLCEQIVANPSFDVPIGLARLQ